MRGLSFLAILLLIWCVAPGSAAAQTDSTAASVRAATQAAAQAPVPVLVLLLEHGVTRDVTFIKPRSDGMAAVTGVDGRVDYIPLYKIQHIEDARGEDRTAEVLRKGHSLGVESPKSNGGWRRFGTREAPRSACGSYLITETGILWRTDTPRQFGGHRGSWLVNLDYGYARNVGDATALGGTVFFGGDEDLVRSGVRLRYVRWLRPNVSLDIAPGIVLLANEKGSSRFKGPGFSSQVGVNFAGHIGLVVQVASVASRVRSASYLPDTLVHNTDWHVGVRLGGGMGVFGTAMLVGFTIFALGSLSSY